MNPVTQPTSGDPTALRPFQVKRPDADLTDLRKRIDATRWPDRETVADFSQGVPSRRSRSSRALGHQVRLAQGRERDQRLAELHHQDRWPGHPFHARSLQA